MNCKQYTETKQVTPLFYIIPELIRFVLMVAAFWIFTPYHTVGLSDVSEKQTKYKTLRENLKRRPSIEQHPP